MGPTCAYGQDRRGRRGGAGLSRDPGGGGAEADDRDLVEVGTFAATIDAELAASLLDAEGIESMTLADDAGGAFPFFQATRGVRLLVRAEDETRAKEILEAPPSSPLAVRPPEC